MGVPLNRWGELQVLRQHNIDKPKPSWKAVTGADKYYVYRSTDGKTFSYWDSTTKTSYINSGAKKNTKYYYKVKAVCASNSNANSSQSSAVSIKATK